VIRAKRHSIVSRRVQIKVDVCHRDRRRKRRTRTYSRILYTVANYWFSALSHLTYRNKRTCIPLSLQRVHVTDASMRSVHRVKRMYLERAKALCVSEMIALHGIKVSHTDIPFVVRTIAGAYTRLRFVLSARDDALDLPYSPFPFPPPSLPRRALVTPACHSTRLSTVTYHRVSFAWLETFQEILLELARKDPCAPINSGSGCGIEYFDLARLWETYLRRSSQETIFVENIETALPLRQNICAST